MLGNIYMKILILVENVFLIHNNMLTLIVTSNPVQQAYHEKLKQFYESSYTKYIGGRRIFDRKHLIEKKNRQLQANCHHF